MKLHPKWLALLAVLLISSLSMAASKDDKPTKSSSGFSGGSQSRVERQAAPPKPQAVVKTERKDEKKTEANADTPQKGASASGFSGGSGAKKSDDAKTKTAQGATNQAIDRESSRAAAVQAMEHRNDEEKRIAREKREAERLAAEKRDATRIAAERDRRERDERLRSAQANVSQRAGSGRDDDFRSRYNAGNDQTYTPPREQTTIIRERVIVRDHYRDSPQVVVVPGGGGYTSPPSYQSQPAPRFDSPQVTAPITGAAVAAETTAIRTASAGSTSSGSGFLWTFVILMCIGAAGFGLYWFVFKPKQAAASFEPNYKL